MPEHVTAQDVTRAAARIQPLIVRTPMVTSDSLMRRIGVPAWLKCENLQRGGAFKMRGAANFVLSIPPAELPKGVVAFSSGNHAQAVAIAASAVGISATIVMPSDAPRAKLEGTRSHGATVVTYDRLRENREAIARQIADETGATVIPPFDHPWIVAGQGTTALEMVADQPDLDTLVVCLGGGGLLSGCALAARAHNSRIRIIGVEPEAGNDYVQSLKAGSPVEIPMPDTIADGLRTTKPGNVTFPLVQSLVDEVVTVSDDELRDTVRFLLLQMKLVVEPSGAAALAAVLHGKLPPGGRRIGVTLSGGNIDGDQLAMIASEQDRVQAKVSPTAPSHVTASGMAGAV